MAKTAAIIIIGNEILSGRIQDTNSNFLAGELRQLGVEVRRITVIPDDADVIARTVSAYSGDYDFVFTAGGVGPTHDDVTMLGVAMAFGLRTEVNPVILEVIRKRCGEDIQEASAKMAELPEGAEVIETGELRFPPVAVRNVYIFPGIPQYLRNKFAAIRERFRSRPFSIRKVYINEEECFSSLHLDQVDTNFPEVAVGSYPRVDETDYKVIVTLESTDTEALGRAFDALMTLLPPEVVVRKE